MPLARRYRTINGTETSVMEIRTGAKDLCMAYAMMNWLAPATILVFSFASDMPSQPIHCWRSTPLEMKKYTVPNDTKEIPTWNTINTDPYSLAAFFSFSRGVNSGVCPWHGRTTADEHGVNDGTEGLLTDSCCRRQQDDVRGTRDRELRGWQLTRKHLLTGRLTVEMAVRALNIMSIAKS